MSYNIVFCFFSTCFAWKIVVMFSFSFWVTLKSNVLTIFLTKIIKINGYKKIEIFINCSEAFSCLLTNCTSNRFFLFTQSLVLVFAHLMHSQMTAVLDFLSSVPSPTGRPALEFVLGEWCAKQHLFVGEYERKVRHVQSFSIYRLQTR